MKRIEDQQSNFLINQYYSKQNKNGTNLISGKICHKN